MFIMFPRPGTGVEFKTSQKEYLQRVKETVGDDSIPVEILGVSKWYINEIVAESYSQGNMYGPNSHLPLRPPLLTRVASALAMRSTDIPHSMALARTPASKTLSTSHGRLPTF